MKYELLPHQDEALKAIKKTFTDRNSQCCGIISIPTGGGKTYTAVNWINELICNQKVKIVWFAQSFELINQAYFCMKSNLPADIEIRRISSQKEHSRVKDIQETDDILLITTQTAIKNYNSDNKFSSFLNINLNNLVCILDEAHHAPAYGFRKMIMDLKDMAPRLWLLGLTATPTYTNEKRRGWLWKIFSEGVIYEVEKSLLQKEGILANENFIYRKTPMKIMLNEEDYAWIVKKHREIPEHIIEELASNKERNEFIVLEYVNNRKKYGKTIIFLDRWYQCEYIKDELIKKGVKTDVIYALDNGRKKSNSEVIESFRKDEFDVLLNVKMLTEGADIPTVQTVFISHETQSYILFNQMIGRCLRGERAGGKKKEANIVLFGNSWDKSIAWYIPPKQGELSEERVERSSHPIYTFPLSILMELNKVLSNDQTYMQDYIDYIPDGWYVINYVEYTYDENDSIKLIQDNACVLQKDKSKFDNLISYLMENEAVLSEEWAKECFDEKKVNSQIKNFSYKFSIDCNQETERNKLIKVVRHIAQNKEEPKYIFANLKLDEAMSKIVALIKKKIPERQILILKREYSRVGSIWSQLYDSFYKFKIAVDMSLNKELLGITKEHKLLQARNEDSYEMIDEKGIMGAVKQRDRQCKCCGINGKNNKLFVEPINKALGFSSVRNLQTLCSRCKKIANGIDFSNELTSLVDLPKFKGIPLGKKDTSSIIRVKSAIRGSINLLYECGAVFDVRFFIKNDKKYCELVIFKGNPINWIESNKEEILYYINHDLKQKKVIYIVCKVIK